MALFAGAAEIDITPPMGTQIAGDIGRRRPVEEVCDPLFARALVLECSGHKVCLLSLDLPVAATAWGRRLRQAVAEHLDMETGAVMVHVTQNHSAPPPGHFLTEFESEYLPDELWWLKGGDDSYHPLAFNGALEAAVQTNANLE